MGAGLEIISFNFIGFREMFVKAYRVDSLFHEKFFGERANCSINRNKDGTC